jgi:hypothetical protein
MGALPEVRGKDTQDRLSNAEVIWLVAKSQQVRLLPGRVVYARLGESVSALNATQPVSRETFEKDLKRVIDDPRQLGSKVFRL